MKKTAYFFLTALVLLPLACGKQDAVYKEFVQPGGYIYPAKPLNLTAVSGFQRVFLQWEAPMDPSIRSTKLFWDNYTDSLEFAYGAYVDGVLETVVDQLDDRSYTFDVVNYDGNGHRSLATEITMVPFGESWLLSHSERSVRFARMSGDDALITMSKSTDEMVATRFRYRTADGKTVVSEYLLPDTEDAVLPGAKKGSRFEYQSAFLPEEGRDTVWAAWTRAMDPIIYPLPAADWEVTVTEDQVLGNYTPDKIFDGIIGTSNRWHSARSGAAASAFPKVLAIDTKAEGDGGYAFSVLEFCFSPSGTSYRYVRNLSIYMGDKPYDPNETDIEGKYGAPVFNGVFNRADDKQQVSFRTPRSARFFAVVFKDSWNVNGFIDLWELIPYGYSPSDAE